MPSDLGVGDADLPYLVVEPADVGTAAMLTVTRPDTTTASATVVGGALDPIAGTSPTQYRQTWTATTPLVYTLPGRWLLHWDVTGTGMGAEDVEVWVVPNPTVGGPTWTPGLTRVAAYIPRLTVDVATPGTALELGTFTTTTNPTDTVAQRHIDDAVAEVLAVCGTIPTSLEVLARAVAAQRAAATIQRAYGATRLGEDSLQTAAALDARADTDLAQLRTAIQVDTADFGVDIAHPVYSFPTPTSWGDDLL